MYREAWQPHPTHSPTRVHMIQSQALLPMIKSQALLLDVENDRNQVGQVMTTTHLEYQQCSSILSPFGLCSFPSHSAVANKMTGVLRHIFTTRMNCNTAYLSDDLSLAPTGVPLALTQGGRLALPSDSTNYIRLCLSHSPTITNFLLISDMLFNRYLFVKRWESRSVVEFDRQK
jgi:hypothetical protein